MQAEEVPRPSQWSWLSEQARGWGGGSWRLAALLGLISCPGLGPEPPARQCALLSSGTHNPLIACSSARRYQSQEEVV